MKQVYAPANLAEAHMLAHMLEQNGIPAHVHGEALQGGVGELPAAGLLQMLVADEDYELARALIADWERINVPAPDAASEKPRVPIWMGMIVFSIGALSGWALKTIAEQNAIPINVQEIGYDQNGDGSNDLTYFYRVGAQYAYKGELDRNFDGSVDLTEYYADGGIYVRLEADDNFDGFAESRTTYDTGNPARTNIDHDRDGDTDVQVTYRSGVISREEIQDARTRQAARVNYYENLRLTRSESDLNGDGFLETVRSYNDLGEVTATETRQPR
jgi:hypothetical protein